jgi:hypothetical protein
MFRGQQVLVIQQPEGRGVMPKDLCGSASQCLKMLLHSYHTLFSASAALR